MNSVIVVVLSFLFFVLPYKTCQSSSPQIVQVPFVDEEITICLKDSICLERPEDPLFLTPYIKDGRIGLAKQKAFVQMLGVKSFSGYLTVSEEYNSNLFFWFFPAMFDFANAPVMLWLQGGPGLTSMFSLFAEHGPFIVTEDNTLKKRDTSWHKYHNIIYIDSPVGTGYSFTDNKNGYSENSTHVALNLHTALVQFFLMFPNLQNNDFFVAGESYAGKYVIALSNQIKNYNIKAKTKINLKGLAIGNGFCDPKYQLLHSDYLYQLGLIDLNGKAEFQKYENATLKFIGQNEFLKGFFEYYKLFGTDFNFNSSLFYNLTGLHPDYHYLNANVSSDLYFYSLLRFKRLIEGSIRYDIHVGDNTFNLYNSSVLENQREDYLKSVINLLQDLLKHYKVLIYHGQLNIINSYSLAENYLRRMHWPGAEKFAKARNNFWIDDNLNLAGYTKKADKLTFVLVQNAGRMVSADQPKLALHLIYGFTRNREF